MENKEIERKWLIDRFPDMPCEGESTVEQSYLSFDPTVRIRKHHSPGNDAYTLTIKGGGTLARTEVELPLTESQYAVLVPLAAVPPAAKRYRRYPLPGGEVLECSCVDEGEPTSFSYAEVEFPDEAAARAFTPPACLGREVTDEPGFSMAAYCRRKAGQKPNE